MGLECSAISIIANCTTEAKNAKNKDPSVSGAPGWASTTHLY